jgi:hypothetical protein
MNNGLDPGDPSVVAAFRAAAPAGEKVPAAPAPAPTNTKMPNGWRERLTPAAVHRSLAAAAT